MWPLLFDARSCAAAITEDEVDRAVAILREISGRQRRAHVAIVADNDELYRWFLRYENKATAIGVRTIRAFRQLPDAERWLGIVSDARELT
jgi:hypothetical protein